ncbi:MAG: hypothetical protein WAO02_15740 [Verrucomicrobiia bacterium]
MVIHIDRRNIERPAADTRDKIVAIKSDKLKIPEAGFTIWLVPAVEVIVNDALLNGLAPRLPAPTLENEKVIGVARAAMYPQRLIMVTIAVTARPGKPTCR